MIKTGSSKKTGIIGSTDLLNYIGYTKIKKRMFFMIDTDFVIMMLMIYQNGKNMKTF